MSAMLDLIIEPLTGTVDGFNTVFETSMPYLPGSVRGFMDGLLRVPTDDDGLTELGGTLVRFREPPEPGMVPQAAYRPSP